jgi:hypothetical protein
MAEVRFLGCDNDVFCASVQARAAEFEQASGHRLSVQLLDNDFYYANKLTDYLRGPRLADVYMSGPVLVWEQLGLGFVRSLDEFAARSPGGLDLADFFGRLVAGSRWSGHFGDPAGTGDLLAIPVNWESYNLAYLPEILDRAGVGVPGSWAEYLAAATAIAARVPGARGFGQRGAPAWHTVYTGFATQLWSCGGRDFDPDGLCGVLRESPAIEHCGQSALCPAARRARRHPPPEPVDVVDGHECPVVGARRGLGVHAVGRKPAVSDAGGAGGQYEPEPAEHLGRRRVRRPGSPVAWVPRGSDGPGR